MVRAYGVAPGTRVLVAGNGPLNLQVAVELLEGGVEVAAVVEASNVMSLWNAGALVAGALASPTLITKGISYLRTLKQSNVPILNRTILIRAEGVDRVERAVTNGIDGQGTPIQGKEHQFEVDTVCVGYGFFPANELTFDHLIPRCLNGKTTWTNVVSACTSCNLKKGKNLLQHAKMNLSNPPFKPTTMQLKWI